MRGRFYRTLGKSGRSGQPQGALVISLGTVFRIGPCPALSLCPPIKLRRSKSSFLIQANTEKINNVIDLYLYRNLLGSFRPRIVFIPFSPARTEDADTIGDLKPWVDSTVRVFRRKHKARLHQYEYITRQRVKLHLGISELS